MPKLDLRGMLGMARQPDAASIDISRSREAAAEELALAETGLAEAETGYRAGLLNADDVALRKLADARTDASVRLDRARALLGAFDEKLDAAQERDRQAEVARVIGIADAAIAEFREAVEIDLPLITEAARRLIRLEAEAELANAEAAKAIEGSGRMDIYAQRPSVSAFRMRPGKARELVDSIEQELWVDEADQRVGDPLQGRIVRQFDGSGTVRVSESTPLRRYHSKRRFVREQYRAAIPAVSSERLAATLAVPGLRPTDPAGWLPTQVDVPSRVLDVLRKLELAMPSESQAPSPRLEIEYRPISPSFRVAQGGAGANALLTDITARAAGT